MKTVQGYLLNEHSIWVDVALPHSNMCVECGAALLYSPAYRQEQHQISPLDSFIDVFWQHVQDGGRQCQRRSWRSSFPLFSGQWLPSDVMGWGVKLWMKNYSEDDADYSSLPPPEPLLSGGISHQRDEDCITQKGKVSRLQATSSDWYHHLDYGLDLGFQKFLRSTVCKSLCIAWFYQRCFCRYL